MISWFQRRSRGPLADAYRAATPRRWPRQTPLEDVRWVALDAETTGFDRATDRILSLAALPLAPRSLRVAEMRDWLVYQENNSANEATAVHGILPSDSRGGQPEREVLEAIVPMLSGAVIVGHHIGFDAGMLDAAMKRHLGIGLRNQVVDTADLAMRHLTAFHQTGYANQRPPLLEEVCAKLGVEMVERHTATGDTFTTAGVFLLFLGRLRQKLGRPLVLADLPLRRV